MRLTIVPIDKKVGIDGMFLENLDLSTCGIPANIHALQWYETEGEVEFTDNPDRTKPQNEFILELPAWANACIDAYNSYVPPLVEAAQNQPQTIGTQTA
jgi:hypothetical protein